MFIKSVNNGGYRHDVNTAFRDGRRAAYNDYIDSFNKALSADVANNSENQRQVEFLSKNYGLQLGMDQAARNDALDFYDKSQKIADAQSNMNIDFARLNNLDAQTDALGESKANTEFAKQATAENTAKFDAGTSQNKLDNLEFSNAKYNTGLQSDIGSNNQQIEGQKIFAQGQQAQNDLLQLQQPGAEDRMYESLVKLKLDRALKDNPNADPTQLETEIRNDPNTRQQAQQVYNDKVTAAQNIIATANGAYQSSVGAKSQGRVSNGQQTRTANSQPKADYKLNNAKEVKIDGKPDRFINEQLSGNSERVGNNIYLTDNAAYFVEGGKVYKVDRPVSTATGGYIGRDEFLRALNIDPNYKAPVIHNSGDEGL